MGADEDERLHAEIELLEAMYPDQVHYDAQSRELKWTSNEGCFILRLPSGYLSDELPDVLSASVGKVDARARVKLQIQPLNPGEEILDSLIASFHELAAAQASEAEARSEAPHASESATVQAGADSSNTPQAKATIIIWLHHLLNTNKRKLALSSPPGVPHCSVSGITKPGYPGVLIYSGPAKLVHEHVAELKAQNWQAFQVRLESGEKWVFGHGEGVREVESMKDVVAAVEAGRKEEFLAAMRMK